MLKPHSCHLHTASLDPDLLEKDDIEKALAGYDALIIPGGFGGRGVEGKLRAIRFAREQKIPFLGICLGMQLAAVEFARHVLGKEEAHSYEFQTDAKDLVI